MPLIIQGATSSETSCTLTQGWHLIGLRGEEVKPVTGLTGLVSDSENSVLSIWKWEENNWAVYLPDQEDDGAFYADSKGFKFLENIKPGEGFWVNTNDSVTFD